MAPETFVWGIDTSTTKIAFAFAPQDGGAISVDSLHLGGDFTEGERLGRIYDQVQIRARQMKDEFPPSVIWIEQPTGRFPKPQLMYTTGVVQAALFNVFGCPVWSLPVGKWKVWSLGFGNASKAQVAAWVEQRSAACTSQDECDAYCIAFAGLAMLTTGRWEKAA